MVVNASSRHTLPVVLAQYSLHGWREHRRAVPLIVFVTVVVLHLLLDVGSLGNPFVTVISTTSTATYNRSSTTDKDVFLDIAKQAFKSGSAGFAAGICQVFLFMWLRCIMNYQYKHGGSFASTAAKLWAEGGIRRFYRGLIPWALLQGPLSRFGDTAANAGSLALIAAFAPWIPAGVATLLGSFAGACWRVFLTPIDTCKTTLQTDGSSGWDKLKDKVGKGGISVLWHGWEGNWAANIVGNYPWFATVNILSHNIRMPADRRLGLLRHASIGAVAATVSDLASNSLRVVKTKKQTNPDPNASYMKAVQEVLAESGLRGLFFRGLETRILVNILQGAVFTVLWKGFSGGV